MVTPARARALAWSLPHQDACFQLTPNPHAAFPFPPRLPLRRWQLMHRVPAASARVPYQTGVPPGRVQPGGARAASSARHLSSSDAPSTLHSRSWPLSLRRPPSPTQPPELLPRVCDQPRRGHLPQVRRQGVQGIDCCHLKAAAVAAVDPKRALRALIRVNHDQAKATPTPRPHSRNTHVLSLRTAAGTPSRCPSRA